MRRAKSRQGRMTLTGLALAVGVMIVTGSALPGESLPIIPGAHGFGMETPAGSGRHLNPPQTRVIKVTNLKDSGPGSLRAALAAKGPRVVVFEVSGYIEANSRLFVINPYVTVAGQTAPWPGIVVRGGYGIDTGNKAHDVLIQHLGVRLGDQLKGQSYPGRGAMLICGHHIVVDHCSFGWGTQAVNVNGKMITLRLNIFSEGLYHAGHNESNHSRALGVGLGQGRKSGLRKGIAIIGNLIAHHDDRNPQVSQHSSVAILNNVIYNYAAEGIKMMQDPLIASIAGNVFIPGPETIHVPRRSFRGKAAWIYLRHAESRVFFSRDNLIAGKIYDNPWGQLNARYLAAKWNSKPAPKVIVWEPPVVVPGYKIKPARATEAWVRANVGPFPAHRGPIDARTIYELKTRSGRGRDDIDDLGGWPQLAENHRKLTLPKHPNADDDKDGYTNLEEWLHAFADTVEGRKGPIPGVDQNLGKREAERCSLKPEDKIKKAKALFEKVKRQPKADWTFGAAEAKRRQKEAAKKAGLPMERKIDLGGGVVLELVLIPPGEFEMGSKYPPKVIKWLRGPARAPRGQSGAGLGAVPLYDREHPRQRIRISKSFYMGKYELTQGVYDKIMGESSQRDPLLPVALKTARDNRGGKPWVTNLPGGVAFFFHKLNATVGKKAGLRFRLPNEPEWEYACRAGTDTPFGFGESISSKQANYDSRFPWDGKQDHPSPKIYEKRGWPSRLMKVGSFKPNPWGLYDTVGNIEELVQDDFGSYPETAGEVVDSRKWSTLPRKVRWKQIRCIRGGNWRSPPSDCRSAYGSYLAVYNFRERSGLRLAADPVNSNGFGRNGGKE